MIEEIGSRVGLIPVALEQSTAQVHWRDLSGFHCYQGFFSEALSVYSALRKTPPFELLSGFEDIPSADEWQDSIPPSAFIFHAGRCGSTLLSKVLARSREHLVFSEAAPHNQIWNLLPPNPEAAIGLYRRLILAMGRRRLSSYRAHIIKFTSWNVLEARFIREAFPGVPAIFIFRRPKALLESYRRAAPSWLGSPHKLVEAFKTSEAAVEAFFSSALSIEAEDFQYLDYDVLTPESLPGILRYLRLTPPPGDLPSMLNEFSWYSKSGALPAAFVPRQPYAASFVPPALEELYCRMKGRSFDPRNHKS